MPTIRPFHAGEWPLYKALRLRALLDAPDAFGSTYAAEHARPDALWASRIAAAAGSTRDLALLALHDDEACGLAWCKVSAEESGMADLFQMWVAPSQRGRGVGSALLGAAIAFARDAGVATLRLGVTVADSPALRLYRRFGFQPVGAPEPLREGSALMAQTLHLSLGPP